MIFSASGNHTIATLACRLATTGRLSSFGMKPAQIQTLFERFAAANPQPRTELEYRTPFELLVEIGRASCRERV